MVFDCNIMGLLGKENSVCCGVQRSFMKGISFGIDLATLLGFIKAPRGQCACRVAGTILRKVWGLDWRPWGRYAEDFPDYMKGECILGSRTASQPDTVEQCCDRIKSQTWKFKLGWSKGSQWSTFTNEWHDESVVLISLSW